MFREAKIEKVHQVWTLATITFNDYTSGNRSFKPKVKKQERMMREKKVYMFVNLKKHCFFFYQKINCVKLKC